jgi:hypothetical protein
MNANANDRQVGGSHYQQQPYQHWDFVLKTNLPYMEAQIVKYLSRWRTKNGVEDLRKAQHFLEKLIEHFQSCNNQEQFAGEYVSHKETIRYIITNNFSQREAEIITLVALAEDLEELQRALELLKNLVAEQQPPTFEANDILGGAGRSYVDQDGHVSGGGGGRGGSA